MFNTHNSKSLCMFSILVHIFITFSALFNNSNKSMKLTVFKLPIIELCVSSFDSSAKAMRLIWFVADHPRVVAFITSTNLDIQKGFNWEVIWISMNFINFYWTFFFECLWCFFTNLRITVKSCLHLIHYLIFFGLLRLVWKIWRFIWD